MGFVAVYLMPGARNSNVIPFDRIHTDMERVLSDPDMVAPCNLVMKAKVLFRGDMEEKAALEEAAKNLPRLYASPACRPQVPIPNGVDPIEKTGAEQAAKLYVRK